ncbi:MAG: phosphoribosylformylglycinamidine synthase [Calditrichaceae bacterium]|nr:phosphoribosylformylglycinamidine synthase [Calditrichaceae bacterium]RQV96717.1 MAG: phosphoribosylformylglycinamidine synthase [Calditrichota bacterium]
MNHIQLLLQKNIRDVAAEQVQNEAKKYLNIDTGKVKSGKIFSVLYDMNPEQVQAFARQTLADPILHEVYINQLYRDDYYHSYILISKLPGVTDDEGVSAQKALCDLLNIAFDYSKQWIFTRDIYYLENHLSEKQLHRIAEDLLGNPLINHFEYGKFEGRILYMPTVDMQSDTTSKTIDIFVDDATLVKLSKDYLLALDLNEMKAIQNYYKDIKVKSIRLVNGLPELPTDTEIEVLAQTWSEHCKHKEFNALIEYKDLDTGEVKTIDSLFKTYIRRSTDVVKNNLEEMGHRWLLKVFSDNAGVVRIDDQRVFIWKVETHNSPSALDPYGGALTGIVGVNRDPLGTGIGGGKLLFNTDVLCFGSPYYKGKLLPGQLHPRRIMSGVVKGIEDGGNKSGIPTVNGSIIFDDRFRGKPLVFCGTGAVMPASYQGVDSWTKPIVPGDRIIMAGGRVGKDGIHGATFSSLEIDEHSPRSAVQIGSPITQKNMSDFMEQAVKKGLIKCSTDNGAGGLSSSIGELATISNGAVIQLDRVPLKYSGLKPWEIFVSESQERMSFVVRPGDVDELMAMAADFEVETTDIGYFTGEGYLDIRFGDEKMAYLDLDFLHNGVPGKSMQAEWQTPKLKVPKIPGKPDHNQIILKLLNSLNICSREPVIRRYDHEVKGKTIVKPLMGGNGFAPQDAGVMRLGFDSFMGIAISNGILPRYGDIDAYQMSAGSFDEAVRGIIAVGGLLPDSIKGQNIFWSVNDNFCVPDSLYHPQNNPDGKYKLAQLVRMNEALFDMATFFNIPMTSGKDSMKNDFIKEGVKISVPPTILYSMVAQIPDVRKTLTAEFKKPGDKIYLVGKTYDELGASEFYKLFNELGANVPVVRKEDGLRIYRKMIKANEQNLLLSAHDLSDGGLAVALAESAFGGNLGAEIHLAANGLKDYAVLYSESHSRFIVTIAEENNEAFGRLFGDDAQVIGTVSDSGKLVVHIDNKKLIDIEVEKLLSAWRSGLEF